MKSLKYIAPHKTALTMSILFAVSSLIFLIPMYAMFYSVVPTTGPNGEAVDVTFPMWMLVVLPISYLVIGYLFTGLFAWLYNLTARFTGGITFKVSE